MLTNTIASVEIRDDKKVYAIVVYEDPESQIAEKREYVDIDPPTPATLQGLITRDMAALTAHVVDPAGLKALLSMQGTSVDVSSANPGDPSPPTDEDKSKTAWGVLCGQLRAAQILSPDHPTRVDLQSQVDTTFQPAFIGLRGK